MATLKKEITISGKGLMGGKECNVTLFPSKEKGIRFFVKGCDEAIVADCQNVVSTENCVVIANNSSKVILIEHFMAACAFANIDALDICLSNEELPILDGSSWQWYQLFNQAGIESAIENKNIEITEPLFYSNEKSSLAILPSNSDLKITYCINFDHPELQNKWLSFDFNQNKNEIIEARTFGYLKDLENYQKMGLALGVTEENTIGLTDSGYTTELRSEFEPIKHKILDLIGDLNLSGINPLQLKAHIIAKEAGHKSHVELSKEIQKYMECKLCHKK